MVDKLLVFDVFQKFLFLLLWEYFLVSFKDDLIRLVPVNLELSLHAKRLSLLLSLLDFLLKFSGKFLKVDPLLRSLLLSFLFLGLQFFFAFPGLFLKTGLDFLLYLFITFPWSRCITLWLILGRFYWIRHRWC